MASRERREGGAAADLRNEVRERLRETARFNAYYNIRPGEKHPQPPDFGAGPSEAMQVGDARRIKGAADQPAVFSALIAGGGVRPCIFQNLGVEPFNKGVMEGSGFTIEHLALIGVIPAARAERGQEAAVRQQIIAETLAPNFPLQQCLSQPLAQEELSRILKNEARFREAEWLI